MVLVKCVVDMRRGEELLHVRMKESNWSTQLVTPPGPKGGDIFSLDDIISG